MWLGKSFAKKMQSWLIGEKNKQKHFVNKANILGETEQQFREEDCQT